MARAPLLAAAILCTLPIAIIVNYIVPEPYMDEIFHVPQAQRFCNLDFNTWDPMITTFPGLYILSLGYKSILEPLLTQFLGHESPDQVCTTPVLRSINILLFLVTVILLREIILELDAKKRRVASSLKAMVLALYPLNWFFTFLYYTDVGSTAAVLAMYLAALKRRFWAAGLLGGVAILFRQTNAVWAAFVLCTQLLNFLQEEEQPELMKPRPTDADLRTVTLRRRRKQAAFEQEHKQQQRRLRFLSGGINHLVKRLWSRKWEALRSFLPLLLVILAFVAFVVNNGGIVVGAKDAHKMSPHFPQFFYLGLFAAAVLAPFHSVKSVVFLGRLFQRSPTLLTGLCVFTIAISLLVVRFFSIAHPYLLADNRHYTFYIWKDIFQAHWIVRYLLVPGYLYSWWWIIQSLSSCRKEDSSMRALWILTFCGATMAVLVPAPLVELRYFTVPFYILALEIISGMEVKGWQIFMLGLGFAAVNAATMGIFLFRPFTWSHEVGTQRFLW